MSDYVIILIVSGGILLLMAGFSLWFSLRGAELLFPEAAPAVACTLCGAQAPMGSRIRYYCTTCRDQLYICEACLQRIGPAHVKCARHDDGKAAGISAG
jgi:hypothetical protein